MKMKSTLVIVWTLAIMIFPLANVSHADLINGDFSVVPDWVYGWNSEHWDINWNPTSPSSYVSANSGYAVLETQGYSSEITQISLLQSVQIPDWAYSLSYDIGFERTDDDAGGTDASTFPDFFQASYFDYFDQSFDRDLLGVDLNGPYDPNTGANINLPEHEAYGINWYHFTTNISDLTGREGILFFDLNDLDDNSFSAAYVDNVSINPVPEPATLLLLGSGLFALAGMARKRRKSLPL